jgi:translation initiation factor 5A
MVIKGRPCKVSDVSTSKTGKHGHAKCNFTAIDIFNNKKYEDIIPSTHNTTAPNVTRLEFTLADIDEEGFCSLVDEVGNVREDIKLPDFPETFAREIRDAFASGKTLSVTVMKAMGHEQIMSMKEETA